LDSETGKNWKNYTVILYSSEMADLFCGVNTDMNYILLLLYCLGYGIFEFWNVWTTWINSSETKQKYNVNQNVYFNDKSNLSWIISYYNRVNNNMRNIIQYYNIATHEEEYYYLCSNIWNSYYYVLKHNKTY